VAPRRTSWSGATPNQNGVRQTAPMNDRQASVARLRSRPQPIPLAAAATGLLVGSLSAGLVWLGMAGCDAWRDSPSCGGGLGIGLLTAVVVISLLVGRVLLGFAEVPDALMVSFLGIATAMIDVLMFLIDESFSVWMWLVLPVLTAATFVASAWLVRALGGTAGPDDRG
jgi:hypothetical protein